MCKKFLVHSYTFCGWKKLYGYSVSKCFSQVKTFSFGADSGISNGKLMIDSWKII